MARRSASHEAKRDLATFEVRAYGVAILLLVCEARPDEDSEHFALLSRPDGTLELNRG